MNPNCCPGSNLIRQTVQTLNLKLTFRLWKYIRNNSDRLNVKFILRCIWSCINDRWVLRQPCSDANDLSEFKTLCCVCVSKSSIGTIETQSIYHLLCLLYKRQITQPSMVPLFKNTSLPHSDTQQEHRKLLTAWPSPHRLRPRPVLSRHAPVWSSPSPLAGCPPPSSAKWLQWHGERNQPLSLNSLQSTQHKIEKGLKIKDQVYQFNWKN